MAPRGRINNSRNATDVGVHRCVLATVSYSGHFRVLLQFYLSFAANVLDPHACGLLALVSTDGETASLTNLLWSSDYASALGSAVLPRLRIVALPTAVARLSPGTSAALPTAKNRGQWGRLYVCAKKAYAARYAHEVLGAEHAIVTDSEAYIWKPLSIDALFASAATRPTVWYADAPVHHRADSRAQARRALPASIDANWCSLHVFGDARGLTRGALAARVPSPSATLFEYMLFSYPRVPFRAYWERVEAAWQRPWFDALVRAHEAEPRCVGVGFWLEVSWHLFLYEQSRRAATRALNGTAPAKQPRRTATRFVNATAAIEDAFGTPFVRRSGYVHARLELLWRTVGNGTMDAFERFYAAHPLPLFRVEFRQKYNCAPVSLIARVAPPAASFQANSAVPNWVFDRCTDELRALRAWRRDDAAADAQQLPWVRHSTVTR